MTTEKKEYKTTDIYIASALILRGAEVIKMDKNKDNKKQVIFYLDATNIELEKILEEWRNKTLLGELPLYISIFKHLKEAMFDKLNTY
jgi:hypothetical protein